MKRILIAMIVFLVLGLWLLPSTTIAQQQLVIKPLAEKKVAELPAGELFWRIENFTTLAKAQAAAGPWGLAAESDGKDWLFTLGPAGGSSTGGTEVAEVGPIPRVVAPQYLLRVNEASGSPGSSRSAGPTAAARPGPFRSEPTAPGARRSARRQTESWSMTPPALASPGW